MGGRRPIRRRPEPPAVTVDVPDGAGMIELVGDDVAGMLSLAGEPVLLDGDPANYSWLFVRAGAQGSAEVKALAEWTGSAELDDLVRHGGADPALPAVLGPLLRLLRAGRYLLTVREPHGAYPVGFRRPGHRVWYFDPYWGGPDEEIALVATDEWPPRDRDRVAHYRDLIARGRRPAVVALFPPGGFVGYLLDGHHKLAAHGQAGTTPPVVAVTPVHRLAPDNGQLRRAVPAFVDAASGHGEIAVLDHLRTLSLGAAGRIERPGG
ncbi:hypothetical protein AB0J86_14025 [Micromonospora sp. NPDC049559]|uniref:hypothetical protein n=1 Tax=Micromonospora sp. NPDC049559 TaxID=3155923 RepID=UPI00343281AE